MPLRLRHRNRLGVCGLGSRGNRVFANPLARKSARLPIGIWGDSILCLAGAERSKPTDKSSLGGLPKWCVSGYFRHKHRFDQLVFYSAVALLNNLTNGSWDLWLNRDSPQEEHYTFTVQLAGIGADSFSAVNILSPTNGGLNLSSNCLPTWVGPTGFDSIIVSVRNSATNTLTATATNWASCPVLAPGTNFFGVIYSKEIASDCFISAPTNDFIGLLTNWTVNQLRLNSKAESGFLTEGLPPEPLAEALDAPGLIWETGGTAAWLAQNTNTTDHADAAQSGLIPDDSFSTLRTVIYGANTISFAWRVDCEGWADYVEFTDNGVYVTDLTGNLSWEQFTYPLTAGVVHVLEWTYYKDSSGSVGADAAYLDQVRVGANALSSGPSVEFNLLIRGEHNSALSPNYPNQISYAVSPGLTNTPPPLSYHEAISPHGWYAAKLSPTNLEVTTTWNTSFNSLLNELTNGTWTLWLNRGTPQSQYFEFTVQSPNLSSNDFPTISITSPPDSAESVSPHVGYQWSGGWSAPDQTFLAATQIRSNATPFVYAAEFAPLTSATNWVNVPALAEGTNNFSVQQYHVATSNVTVSLPFLGWSLGAAHFVTSATSSFTVSNAAPIQLLSPQVGSNEFHFSFYSPWGFTNHVQSCTNLTNGSWIERTNLPSKGALQTVYLPMSLEPIEFFRIVVE